MTETPKLEAPPVSVINDLERRCKVYKDKQACAWVVKLEKHYEKLE